MEAITFNKSPGLSENDSLNRIYWLNLDHNLIALKTIFIET